MPTSKPSQGGDRTPKGYNKRKKYPLKEHKHKLQFAKHYVLEVSFRPGNPVHRAIGCYKSDGHWEIWNGTYEAVQHLHESQLNFIGVLGLIEGV